MKKVFTSSSLWSCFIALVMMMASQSAWAEYVKLTALSGSKSLSDGEGCAKLVDAVSATKWGQSFDPSNPDRANAWVVVKAEKAVVPNWYFLLTGNDTGGDPGRNWKSWNIYGGNFASDAEAVRGSVDDPAAGGWTLIDERNGEALPQANFASQNFQFNEADGTAYQYFWIEVLESVKGTDTYLQMSEWGLGTYGEFEKYLDDLANVQTGTDEPIVYTIISGDRNDGSGEGLDKLFDGRIDTKWGNGFTAKAFGATSNGAYFIVKTSREIAPTYYKLVTGTDNASWKHRNWKNWQIYGIAAADVQNGKPTRDQEGWVMLDNKANVTEEVLPDKNMFTVIFSLDPGTETAYQYFKVEIDEIMSGSGYMQMGEFSLGDEYTLALDRKAILDGISFDPDVFAEKALLDQMAETIASLEACTDPFQLGGLNTTVDELTSKINASAANYAELITVRNQAINLINDDNLTDAAMAYAQAWISEEEVIAPNDEYPAGNFGYIKANRQLTGEEALAEARRINDYLLANVKVVDDPIYVEYETIIDANGFNDGEMGHSLIDGDRENTKWCANTSHKPWRLVFKSSDPIKPTYYGLVTGGDTYSYPDRNWKTWKIWAANFDSDEDVTEESDKWVLIDEKNNVGTDVLKTTNKYESYINLSIGCTVPYQYFKIVVEASGGDLIQMNEFTFYNQGNLAEYREDFLSEFDDYDPTERPAYIGYVNQYNDKYATLQNATNPSDVMKAYNDLKELQEQITASADLYDAYQAAYDELSDVSIESESLSTWFEGYSEENEGAGVKYLRGTYAYIMETLSLDNDGIKAETAYLQNIITAIDNGLYILLDGHTNSQWGDGYYGHLININKDGYLEGGNEAGEVKWGGEADINGNTYIIFRTLDPTNPFFYTLTTGNDTEAYYGRNWGTWYIYGANFEGDGAATKDAEGWVLIDSKENVGQDRLHPVNNQPSYFGFSTETTEEYLYYKVVVTKAYSGSAIQMNELHFGTPEEFEDIKDQYIAAANEFDYDVVAEQALIDEYEGVIEEIEECVNMEALFRANYKFETLRDKITASAAVYAQYQEAVDAVNAYLEENKLAESDALTVLLNYLNNNEEASELYPNGTSVNILGDHVLADSVVIAELDFLEELKAAAVAAGYGPGMDVSSLIVNRTFAKAGDMLKDEDGKNLGREAEGWNGYIYRTNNDGESKLFAAEFCNEVSKFDINQTLTDLKNGFYKLTLNAGFRAQGNLLSYDYAAMAYANDVATYIPVVREDVVEDSTDAYLGQYPDKMIYNADSTESYGIGIWGCEGASHAFSNGRYAVTLVAQVTDGTLTVGVKNDGTVKGGDWTAAGNFGLVYLGETEADAAAALAEAAGYNAERITTLTEIYEATEAVEHTYVDPGFGAAQKEALAANSGVGTYAAEKAISETMQAIYDTKNAYYALHEASEKVHEKWYDWAGVDEVEDAVYEVKEGLDTGAYDDADAALAAKAQLYADYPEYLQVKGDKGTNVDYTHDAFTLDIITTGVNPSIELTTLYEPLEKDEVILAFDYASADTIKGGYMYYESPNLLTDVKEEFVLPATEGEWKTVYVKVDKGINTYGFGSAIDHSIFWSISSEATKDNSIELQARNFHFITRAEMQAAGGSPINGGFADVNGDNEVDIADVVAVLNIMASDSDNLTGDVNGDGVVDIADVVAVLNIMAQK